MGDADYAFSRGRGEYERPEYLGLVLSLIHI